MDERGIGGAGGRETGSSSLLSSEGKRDYASLCVWLTPISEQLPNFGSSFTSL